MIITKRDVKILKFIKSHHSTSTRIMLISKFDPIRIDKLNNAGYIKHNHKYQTDKDGFRIPNIPDTALYFLTDLGIAEVENHQWFDTKFVITQILLPIVLAILTTFITLLVAA